MTLSKLEIQQMLREMNVKFHADDSYETLKQRLQAENHSRWLKSVSTAPSIAGEAESIRVRKRKAAASCQDQAAAAQGPPIHPETPLKPSKRFDRDEGKRSVSPHRPPPTIEKPLPGKPWKSAAEGTEPFNRKKHVFDTVLRRAKMCCERCGIRSGRENPAVRLEPFHILPLSQGGENSIKNVVALCAACRDAISEAQSIKDIKDLKRKTRTKLYKSLEVVIKRSGHSRHPEPDRGE
jgi:5-methylcytosine-specific restriction endonuclease McrA